MMLRLLLLTALLPAMALSAHADAPISKLLVLMADRDYARAAAACEAWLTRHPRDANAGLVGVLRARAFLESGQTAQALAAAASIARGGTAWAGRARFLEAEALLEAGRTADAVRVFGEALPELAGAKAMARLAARYRALIAETAKAKTPAAGLLIRLHTEAHAVEPDPARRREALAALAAALQAAGRHRDAITRWTALLGDRQTPAALSASARYHRGLAYLGLRPTWQHVKGRRYGRGTRLTQAREDFRALLDRHPTSPDAARALYQLGKSFSPTAASSTTRARGIARWTQLLERFPKAAEARHASYELGLAHAAGGDLDAAVTAWDAHVTRFADDTHAGDASFGAGRARVRQGRHRDAIRRLTAYLKAHPTGSQWQAARQLIEDATFGLAARDLLAKRDASAATALAAYLAAYPAGRHATRAHFELGGVAQRAGKTDEATRRYRTLVARFASDVQARRARLELARLAEQAGDLDQTAAELTALIRVARRTPEGRQATEWLLRLQRVELDLVTPRVFGTRETPQVKVDVRNLPSLELLAYRLDVAAYIARHRSLKGIEKVVTEIVGPDLRQTRPVTGYVRLRRQTLTLSLPELKGPGAWIVELRTPQRRAKTLVLVSDLRLVARVGRREAVALVERNGAPLAGARVELFGAGGRLTQVTTGADGTARARWDTATDSVRLLARHEGHVAFAGGAPRRAQTAPLTARGLVYTDRPLYRPGDVVHYRALLRRVEGDAYRVPAGAPAVVEMRDPRGLLVARQTCTVDAFGAVDGQVQLGREPSLGEYRLSVRLGGLVTPGTFWVEAYRHPPFDVTVTPDHTVRFPGETVRVDLSARYRFGTAVAGATIELLLARVPYAFDADRYRDFAWFVAPPPATRRPPAARVLSRQTARTDAQGRARLSLRLPEADRAYRYHLIARVTDAAGQRAVGGAATIGALVGCHALLRPERKVTRPGMRATATLLTVRPDHTPLSLEGTLTVDRQVATDRWETVHRGPARTDDVGRGVLTVTLAQPGRHRLRFAATDRGGNAIRAEALLEVAGPSRAPDLVLRAERMVYRRGETARVHLMTPVADRHVLVTFEADGIIDHRVIHVAGRSTTFDLPMRAAYAPNGQLTATLLHDNRLYTDRDPLMVLQHLEVELRPDALELRPGGTLGLAVQTRDQNGRPVAAAVSIAVVDQAVLQLRADPTPAIKPHFYHRRRGHGVRGVGSRFVLRARPLDPLSALREEIAHSKRVAALRKEVGYLARPAQDPAAPPRSPSPKPRKATANAPGMSAGGWGKKGGEKSNKKLEQAEVHDTRDLLMAERFKQLADGENLLMDRAQLSRLMAGLSHRRRFADTAAWRPSVVTDARGRAQLSIDLPDNLTTWKITARGATKGEQFGEARASVRTGQPLMLQLRAPAYLVEGDRAEATLEVHNATSRAREVAIGARQTSRPGRAPVAPDRRGQVDARGVHRAPIALTGRQSGVIEASAVVAGGDRDAVQRPLPVQPAGVRILRTGAGRLASAASRDLSLPPRTDRRSARLLIGVDPDPDRPLERALEALRQFPYGCLEQTVSRFLPGVAAVVAYQQLNRPNDRLRSVYVPLARAGLARLYDLQHPQGGWGWWAGRDADPLMTGYALMALETCRTSGLVEVLPERLARARRAATALYGQADDTGRALLLYAMAPSGVDLGRARALQRRVESLSPAGLALLCLAFDAAGRAAEASDLAARLARQAKGDGGLLHWSGRGTGGLLDGTLESTALGLLALARAGGESERARCRAAADYLLSKRRGAGWGTTKTSALCVLALAAARPLLAAPATDYVVTIKVNETLVGTLTVARGEIGAQRLEYVVGADALKAVNRIVIDKQGEGVLHFWYRLEAFRRGKVAPDGNQLAIQRRLRRASDPAGGAPAVEPGHTILLAERRPQRRPQPVSQARTGDVLRVELTITAERDTAYVIVEDPLPAGVRVLEQGREGPFDRAEARLDRMAFFFTRLRRGTHRIRYLVRAEHPGRYGVNPPRCEAMYQPAVFAHGASAQLQIARESAREAAAEETPDSLLARAERAFAAGAKDAEALYLRLAALPLRPQVRAGVARRLITLRRSADSEALIEAYQLLREADPRAQLAFADLRRIADAYVDADRPVQALELYRILYDRRLGRFVAAAATLRAAGKPHAAQQLLEDQALLRFPATPVLIERAAAWAAAFATITDTRRGGIRARDEAIRRLARHQALWPASPTARQASAQIIALARAMRAHPVAVREAQRHLKRYPDAPRRDQIQHALATSAFAAGQLDVAAAAARELGRATVRIAPNGPPQPSPFRPAALFLRAQILHSQGQLAAAIALYEQVADRFPEAADTVRFYRRKALEAPSLWRVRPGAAVALPLKYRNLRKLSVAVYPVDLLTLFLMRRGRGTMGGIDLSGITPRRRASIDLPPATGFDLRERAVPVAGLTTGAYLVVLRGQDLERSTFVIISDVDVRVQRRKGRIYVHASRAGKPAVGLQVRISCNQRIVARGRTDARGLFASADGGGDAEVLVWDGKAYALWSSTKEGR